jgi:hypothetical protein
MEGSAEGQRMEGSVELRCREDGQPPRRRAQLAPSNRGRRAPNAPAAMMRTPWESCANGTSREPAGGSNRKKDAPIPGDQSNVTSVVIGEPPAGTVTAWTLATRPAESYVGVSVS